MQEDNVVNITDITNSIYDARDTHAINQCDYNPLMTTYLGVEQYRRLRRYVTQSRSIVIKNPQESHVEVFDGSRIIPVVLEDHLATYATKRQ